MNLFNAALVALVLLASPLSSMAQGHTSPQCLNEQTSDAGLQGAISEWMANGGAIAGHPPPGIQIMSGPFGDPAFSNDQDWRKYAWTTYHHRYVNGAAVRTRYVVQMHYMVNLRTSAIAQIKFATTPAQGCVGNVETVPSSGLDPAEVVAQADLDGSPPVNWYTGVGTTFLATNVEVLRTPSINVIWSPNITVINDAPPRPSGGGCGGGRDHSCPIQQRHPALLEQR